MVCGVGYVGGLVVVVVVMVVGFFVGGDVGVD